MCGSCFTYHFSLCVFGEIYICGLTPMSREEKWSAVYIVTVVSRPVGDGPIVN